MASMDDEAYFILRWKISNFQLKDFIQSPVVSSENMKGSKYSLLLRNDTVGAPFIALKCESKGEQEAPEVQVKIELFTESKLLLHVDEDYETYKLIDQKYLLEHYSFDYYDDELVSLGLEEYLIIQCHIKAKAEINKTRKCEVETCVNFDHNSFDWIISNINLSTMNVSRKFWICSKDLEFEITFSLGDKFKYCRIKVKELRYAVEKGETICKVALLENNGGGEISEINEWDPDDEDWGKIPKFIKKQFLLENSKYVRNNTFTLKFDFYFPKTETSSSVKYHDSDSHSKTILGMDLVSCSPNDFRYMLDNGLFSDIRFQVGSEIIDAHKCVLATRSLVFRTMFEQDMMENKTGVVNITDCDPKVFKTFFHFLYSGQVNEMDSEEIRKLLLVADKYDVQSLKNKCSIELTASLNVENVCGILSTADMVGIEELKNAAIHFTKTHALAVLPSDEWKKLIKECPQLATEVLCRFSAILEMSI